MLLQIYLRMCISTVFCHGGGKARKMNKTDLSDDVNVSGTVLQVMKAHFIALGQTLEHISKG